MSDCEGCKDALMTDLLNKSLDLLKGEALTRREWKAFFRLYAFMHYYPEPQSKQVCEGEADYIRQLRLDHGFSTDDLAWIFMRSKSTINAVLNGKHKGKKRTNTQDT